MQDRLLRIDDLDVSKYRLTTSEATNLLRGWGELAGCLGGPGLLGEVCGC